MTLREITDRIGYFPIAFFVFSVGSLLYFYNHKEYLDKSEYYELTRQLTPNKKYYIYYYARQGGMAFSSDITGYRLLERDERFAENAGKEFPYSVDGWLSKDTVVINGFDQPGIGADTLPSRIEYERLGNFTIKRVFYKSSVNGGGGADYTCDSLYISKGKLIVLGVKDGDSEMGAMAFPLGPITVYPHAGIVSKLEVNALDKYYNSNNEPYVLSDSYTFIPYKSVLISDLGETGFFLSIK